VAFISAFNIEVEKDRDLRVNVAPQNMTGSGFEMKLGTWKSTLLACFKFVAEFVVVVVVVVVVAVVVVAYYSSII
jgi:hypothetical protein